MLVGWLSIERTHDRLTHPSSTDETMSALYTFDLTGETTDEEIHTEGPSPPSLPTSMGCVCRRGRRNVGWRFSAGGPRNDARQENERRDDDGPPLIESSPNAIVSKVSPSYQGTENETSIDIRRTSMTPSKSGSSNRKKTTPNVFDGISREIESELRRCEDPCQSVSSDADVENEGMVLSVWFRWHLTLLR